MAQRAVRHEELRVYQRAFELAMQIFELSKTFPSTERYALTDQIRRSSRAVCANLAEAWRRRRYRGSFIHRLSDADAEAAETQTWLAFAERCGYLNPETARQMRQEYDAVAITLVSMITHADGWLLPRP